MAPKRRRSERGPISLAVRALLELPDTIVAEILRLVDTGRYLDDFGQWLPSGFGQSAVYLPWAGTRRMVNRQYLMHRFWKPEYSHQDHMDHFYTLQLPQPLVY